jgi:hypothetical protein
MRKVNYLIIASFVICMAFSTGFAQGNPRGNNRDRNGNFDQRQLEMQDLEMRGKELRDLDKERSNRPPIDAERLHRIELNNAIKELDEAGDALLVAVKDQSSKKDFKDSAKLAEKIAKLSKGFRKELNKKSPKAEPCPIPDAEGIPAQLLQLAETIDKRIEQVIYPLTETLNSVRVGNDTDNQLEQTCKQLAEIESNALSLFKLARRKN